MSFISKHILYFALITFVMVSGISCEKKIETSKPVSSHKLLKITESTSSKLSSDKVTFEYDYSTEILLINHTNAAFSYCSKKQLEVVFLKNKIIISEKEKNANCDSLGLYNVEIKINSLPKGKYKILIKEPYVSLNTEKLEFEIDLNETNKGSFLVKRNFYPWGN